MLEKFKAYLIQKGFREFSSNGSPSTAIDYCWRLEKICLHENITVEKLATDISKYLQEYSIGLFYVIVFTMVSWIIQIQMILQDILRLLISIHL